MPTPTWADTTLCTVNDVKKEIRDLSLPLQQKATVEADCQEKIDLVKIEIAEALQVDFPRYYSDSVAERIRFAEAQRDQAMERAAKQYEETGDAAIEQPFGFMAFPGNAFSLISLRQFDGPSQTFYTYGPPATGEHAGVAENGAWLCDMRYSALYVNVGTLTVPVWELFQPEDCINKILNADVAHGGVLRRTAVAGTIVAMLEDGAMRNRAVTESASEVMEKLIPRWDKRYKERMEKAMPLLKIDVTGDGLISEFERQRTRQNNQWIA
jgi:hypothetical protein